MSIRDARHFFIELDGYTSHYFPGQTVAGKAVRVLEKAGEEIEYVNINFQGKATASLVTKKPGANNESAEVYFDVTGSLNDVPPIIKKPIVGRTEFPFTFELPEGIPSSYKDTDVNAPCRIFYQVQVTYRAKGVGQTEMMDLVNIPVVRPWVLTNDGYVNEPKIFEGKTQMSQLCFCKSTISFKVTINKTVFLIGEKIEVLAELANNSKKNINQVEVWISRSVFFRGSDEEIIHIEIYQEPLGEKFSLPGISPGQSVEVPVSLEIPKHQQINEIGCSFMASFYQFHIKMVIPGGEDLTGETPVLIVEAVNE